MITTVHGSERARTLLLDKVTSALDWSQLLDPAFLRRRVYFIRAGELEWDESVAVYVPDIPHRAGDQEQLWDRDDAMFVPLDGPGGRRYGIISVDEPVSGLRPDNQQLDVFSAFAAHAVLAIESADLLGALGHAVVRYRAVIDSALDCVIAMDVRGAIQEFNPAAERTFGYRSEDVVGLDLGELLIPSEHRAASRDRLLRCVQNDDPEMLGQRIETTAGRADGTTLPIELTLTRVQGAPDEEPVLYGYLRDISERRRGEQQLSYLAYHDPLTGLANRALVENHLDLAIARARRDGLSVAVMFFDLDDFKVVNDRLGHAAGDRLLTAAAERLRRILRGSDVLARHGGDEFLIVLSDLRGDPVPKAEKVAGEVLSALREPFVIGSAQQTTTASIGISLYPYDAADTEALLRHADMAMYVAKAHGGGRLAFHELSGEQPSRRVTLSAQLERAIAARQLELHYQPIWRLGPGGGITGVEALLRWLHPERGLLLPELFLHAAEQSTVGDELTDWVVQELGRHASAWRAAGLRPLTGINVSPHQLRTRDFTARLLAELESHDLDPRDFVVELTESAWTVDALGTLTAIQGLQTAGVALAIDDFGTGYSSLARLRQLEFDYLKVDRELLRDVPADPTAVAVMRAILDLGRACCSELIVEGVESEAQRGFLETQGVRLAQGFHLGRPQQHAEAGELLERFLVRDRQLEPGPESLTAEGLPASW